MSGLPDGIKSKGRRVKKLKITLVKSEDLKETVDRYWGMMVNGCYGLKSGKSPKPIPFLIATHTGLGRREN